MTADKLDHSQGVALAALSAAHRRTFDALFQHPLAHNLEWKDVVALIGKLGEVREPSGNEFLFELGGRRIVLHHLHRKDQSRERGQQAPEEPAYYAEIAAAIAVGGAITVVGHGTGHSNAAHHLVEYLKMHHPDTYQRIIQEKIADLSAVTDAQLVELARHSP